MALRRGALLAAEVEQEAGKPGGHRQEQLLDPLIEHDEQVSHGGDDAQPQLGLCQHQPAKVVAAQSVQAALLHGLRTGRVAVVEEHRFAECLAGAHVTDGGRTPVAEGLEDLH